MHIGDSVPSFGMICITPFRRYHLLNLYATLNIRQKLHNLVFSLPFGLAFVSFEAQEVARLGLFMEVTL
jgi:hypothetical protein